MKCAHLSLTISAALAATSITAAATTFTSFRDGPWYRVDPSAIPACVSSDDNPWNEGADPGGGDNVEIQNHILVNRQVEVYDSVSMQCGFVDTPEPTSVSGVDLNPGGDLSIDSTRTLIATGASTWAGGTVNNNGAGHFVNQGTLDVTGSIYLVNALYDNNATLIIDTAGVWNMGGAGVGPTFTNYADGVWQLKGNANFGGGYIAHNYGLVQKSDDGVSTISGGFGFYNEIDASGTLGGFEVDSGVLSFATDTNGAPIRAYSYGATYNIAPGAALELATGTYWTLAPSQSTVDAPVVEYLHTGIGGGEFRVLGGSVLYGAGAIFGKWAVLDFAPGMLHVQGGGNIECATAPGLINRGDIVVDDGNFGGTCDNEGSIHVSADGQMQLVASTFTNTTSGTIELGSGSTFGTGNSAFFNDGVLRVPAGASPPHMVNQILYGNGTLQVLAGATLAADELNLLNYNGGVRLDAGSSMNMVGGVFFRNAPGHLSGNGTLSTDQYIDQSFQIDVGGPLGALYLNAPMLYERAAALTQFHIQGTVAGSGYSQLFLSGDLPQAGGMLRVNFENGFAPHAGDTFDLITVNGVVTQSMQYQVQIGGLAAGFQYTVQLSDLNTVRLTAVNDGASLPDPVFANGFDG